MASNSSIDSGRPREEEVIKGPSSVKPVQRKVLRHSGWHSTFLILLLLNVYCISFFFVYIRLDATWYLDPGTKPEEYTGPPSTTILKPPCEEMRWVGDVLYITYYPIHRFLKYKNWAWTLKNMNAFYGGEADSESTGQ
ncbi:MAG: hypothetical protein ACYST2_06200 [Planctomycetota bacterium]